MAASSQSMSVAPAIQASPIPSRRPLALTVVRRAMPLVTASAGVALATLAAERALAGLALRGAERVGLHQPMQARARGRVDDGILRVTVTRTTVVERITTRR